MTCLEHCKFKENQENARKINRAEAPAASGTIGNHRKSFKFLPNSFQISIWASLGFSKPLKSLPRESGLPKPENHEKSSKNGTISFYTNGNRCKMMQNTIFLYSGLVWSGLLHIFTPSLHLSCFFHRILREIACREALV